MSPPALSIPIFFLPVDMAPPQHLLLLFLLSLSALLLLYLGALQPNISGLLAGPSPTSPPAPRPAAGRAPAKQKLPALAEDLVVDTEINEEILRAAALRKRHNNQVCFQFSLPTETVPAKVLIFSIL